MKTNRRRVLLGSVSAAIVATGFSPAAFADFSLDLGQDEASRKLLVRMVRVMYPHQRFTEAPYERTVDAVLAASSGSPAQKVAFAAAVHDLRQSGFAEMEEAAALAHLKGIEATPFFQMIRSTAVVTLYDDPEVWELLGYEGPSFDKGGYINRGFNDLDWLPDPRIEELEVVQ